MLFGENVVICTPILDAMPYSALRKDARVVEEARLESVYTSKAYPGFESPSFRKDFEILINIILTINKTN